MRVEFWFVFALLSLFPSQIVAVVSPTATIFYYDQHKIEQIYVQHTNKTTPPIAPYLSTFFTLKDQTSLLPSFTYDSTVHQVILHDGAKGDIMFGTDQHTSRIEVSGTGFPENTIPENIFPSSVVVDPNTKEIYFSVSHMRTVFSVNPRLNTAKALFTIGEGIMTDIEIDVVRRHLYVATREPSRIYQLNLSGSNPALAVFLEPKGHLLGLFVEPVERFIYWTTYDPSSKRSTIERACLETVSADKEWGFIVGLEQDPITEKWARKIDTLCAFSDDVTSTQNNNNNNNGGAVVDVVVDVGLMAYVYWLDIHQGVVARAPLNHPLCGANGENIEVLAKVSKTAWGLSIFQDVKVLDPLLSQVPPERKQELLDHIIKTNKFMEAKDWHSTVRELEAALALDPHDYRVLTQIGVLQSMVYRSMTSPTRYLYNALRASPKHRMTLSDNMFTLAAQLGNHGLTADAGTLMKEAFRLNPKHERRMDYSEVLTFLARLDEAAIQLGFCEGNLTVNEMSSPAWYIARDLAQYEALYTDKAVWDEVKDANTTILVWTSFWGRYPYMLRSKSFMQQLARCGCRVTDDRRELSHAKAVVFHAHWKDIRLSDVPYDNVVPGELNIPALETEMYDVRNPWQVKNRPDWQRFVLVGLEPALSTQLSLTPFPSVFNWTMSYRKDADFVWTDGDPYGLVCTWKTHWQKKPSCLMGVEKIIANKLPGVAPVLWVASNCGAKTRYKYVERFMKYIKVDAFGPCLHNIDQVTVGNETLSFNDRLGAHCRIGLENNLRLYRGYKFYLSIENSFCQGYLSEKYWNALSQGIVPIMWGTPDSDDYAPTLANSSYPSTIRIEDFETPRQLADYLNYLDQNSTAYAEYFKWHTLPFHELNPAFQHLITKLQVLDDETPFFDTPHNQQDKDRTNYVPIQDSRAWCKMCQKLRNDSTPRKVYPDIHTWWVGDKCIDRYGEMEAMDWS